eukprot:Partr_v1_DN26783_c0_g1_i2_m8742 putative eukaryotic translation initiation factor
MDDFLFSYRSSDAIGFARFPSSQVSQVYQRSDASSTAAPPSSTSAADGNPLVVPPPSAATGMGSGPKTTAFSADGRFFAWKSPEGLHILDVDTQKTIVKLPLTRVLEFAFSPRGTYLSTFERMQKSVEGSSMHSNVQLFHCESARIVASFSHKNSETWHLQWTDNESHFGRLVTNNVNFHDLKDPEKVCSKLALEGVAGFSISPGRNPSVAVFVPERKGQPAIVRLYGMLSFNFPLSNKSFFKSDEIEFKWNPIGTNVLVLTRTITDKSGKSYYGETNLYYLSAVGNYDCRVELDAPGAVHEIAWAPDGKEFIVVYGNVPAKAALFDSRANKIFDFGASAKNFVRYSPKGRLILMAGFGNLAGYVEIWERQHLRKVNSYQEDLAVYCEFTPQGTNILTATLSPRLRVDNRFRIRNYKGEILWQQDFKELYSVTLRPSPVLAGQTLEDKEVIEVIDTASSGGAVKSAYVPPHLRNGAGAKKTPSATFTKPKQQSSKPQAPAADQPSELEKQIKVLDRKLRQIAALKEKQAAGEDMEKNQLDKIAGEEELADQLAKLKLQIPSN